MRCLQPEDVLKNQQLNDSQKENFRDSLTKCKYSKLKYHTSVITSPIFRAKPYEISDDENSSVDLNRSFDESVTDDYNVKVVGTLSGLERRFDRAMSRAFSEPVKPVEHLKSTEKLKTVTSKEIDELLESNQKEENVNIKKIEFQLSEYEKRQLELEDMRRAAKSRQMLQQIKDTSQKQQEKKPNNLKSKLDLLKQQQKLLRESIPVIQVKSPEKLALEKKREEERLNAEKEEQVERAKQAEFKLKLNRLIQDLQSLEVKCSSGEHKSLFDREFLDELKKKISEIELTKLNETLKSSELAEFEKGYADECDEFNTRVSIKIKDYLKLKALKEMEEAEQKAKQEKLNQEKYLNEIERYKTKYCEMKSFFEHLIRNNLEVKKAKLTSFTNAKQLSDQLNEIELQIKSHLKDLDAFVTKTFDKYKAIQMKDQSTGSIDQIFQTLSENLNRHIRLGQEYDTKLQATEQAVLNLEKEAQLLEQKRIAQQMQKEREAEQARLDKEKKEKEEQERKLKQQQEEQAKKQAELEKKKALVNNVDSNDKNGINHQTAEEFKKSREFFEKLRSESEAALSDKTFKMYKFDLQKAINFPLNSLLDDKTNMENIRNFNEKIRTLVRLLDGQTCSITSSLEVNPTKHPSAINFCLVYLARKLVEKAEESVSNRPDTAFQYAQLVREVFKKCPQFETILIGQLQERCPFVVPHYKPRLSNQTDNEYFESLGYKVTNGKIEDEIQFYKRMTGVLHLYFTLLMTSPNLREIQPATQFHFSNGFKKAWQWLTDVLNMTPRPDSTAEMLAIYFKCCGYQMSRVYGRQFLKLVSVCFGDFFQLIKSIPRQSGASVGRLETLIENYSKTRSFPEWKDI